MAILFAAIGLVATLFLPPLESDAAQGEATPPEPSLTSENAGELCLGLAGNPTEYISDAALRRRWDLRRASCNMAFAAHPENTHFKVAVAKSMPPEQKAEAIAMLREAAAQGDAEAYYEIYEHHKSWERGDLDKTQLVTRAEADQALHRAAELGHPFSMQMLAVLLDRGDIVKRDPAAARYWAERAVANPAKDESKGDLQVLLGRLLVRSDKPDERARGLDILERLASRRAVRRQAGIGDRHPQGRSHAGANIARGVPTSRSWRRDRAACGNADRGRRRPGRPEARVVPVEGSFR